MRDYSFKEVLSPLERLLSFVTVGLDLVSGDDTDVKGLYGFSTATPIPLFPSLKLHYWSSVLKVLRERMGADVIVVGVNGCVNTYHTCGPSR